MFQRSAPALPRGPQMTAFGDWRVLGQPWPRFWSLDEKEMRIPDLSPRIFLLSRPELTYFSPVIPYLYEGICRPPLTSLVVTSDLSLERSSPPSLCISHLGRPAPSALSQRFPSFGSGQAPVSTYFKSVPGDSHVHVWLSATALQQRQVCFFPVDSSK